MNLANWRSGWFDPHRRRFWAWIGFVLYALAGFLIVPWLARDMLVEAIEARLDVAAKLVDVDFNPFLLSARFEGFELAEPSGRALVKFDVLEADFQASSLFRRAYTFSELRVANPFVDVVRTPTGFNLRRLVPEPTTDERQVGSPSNDIPLRLLVSRLEVIGGRLDFEDRTTAEPYRTELGPIEIVVNDLNTLPGREGRQQITVQGEGGARIDWNGTINLNPLTSSGTARLTGLPLSRLSVYIPESIAARLADGSAGLRFDYDGRVDSNGTLSATIDDLSIDLDGIRLERRSAEVTADPLFALERMTLSGASLGWPERTVSIERVEFDEPALSLDRDANGRFTWETLVRASEASAAPAEVDPAPDGERPWQVDLATLAIHGGAVRFDDATLTPAARLGIAGVSLGVESLTLEDGARMPFTLKFTVESGGRLDATGTLALRPDPEVTAKVEVAALALNALQPYLEPSTWLEVRSGTLAIQGDVASNRTEAFSFDGSSAVADLAVVHTRNDVRIAEWKTLAATGVRVRATARQAELANVSLEDAYARIHINDSGELNVRALLREPDVMPIAATDAGPPGEAPTAAASPWAIKVTRFDLKRSSTDFSDDNVPIPFRTAISNLDGRLTTLDTTSRKAADIELEGQVGEFGQVRVEGALQPLDVERETRFTARFSNIDLRDATPYAIRFAGHRIERGKLDLDTQYELRDARLTAEHAIVLRDFALGERVEHPDALDLPLNLAVSLLKGPDGNISVDLPIEGDVDDPQFRIGGIIRQAIVNLLTKIITAPFRLLGMLVGMGGQDSAIDRVEFAVGRADLAPPEREKIVKLAQALALRPQLQLGVPAAAAPAADGLALREQRVRARIDAAAIGADQAQLRAVVEGLAAGVIDVAEREAMTARFTNTSGEADAPPQFDEAAYIDAVRQRLVDAEMLEPSALQTLGETRRDQVVSALLAEPGMNEDRIAPASFAEVEPDDDQVPLVFTVGTLPASE